MKDNNEKFDQNAYLKKYHADHYKKINVNMTKEQNSAITEYCKDMGISQSKYMTACALYCMNNAIDIEELLMSI